MTFKQSGSGHFTSTHDKRDSRMAHMSNEVIDKIVGPMPAETFLEEFLPTSNNESPSLESYQEKMEIVSKCKNEREMYIPFSALLIYRMKIEAIKPLCRDFYVGDTHDLPFTAFHTITIKPDVCIYNLKKPSKSGIRNITKVEMMLELKYDQTHDPFCDAANQPLLNSSLDARHTLGQITSYASAHQAAQFRSHIFSLLVFPRYARILRWDRSGVIVTEKIPLSSDSLLEFFHRYNFMTPEKRGIDATVTKPPRVNKTKAHAVLGAIPVIQLSVKGLNDGLYIVPHDLYMDYNRSPFGRSTRAFIAYSMSEEKKVFVKDTWRLGSQTPEHELYKELAKKKVPYIATVLNAGNVLDQQTRTQDFVEADKRPVWAKDLPKKLRKHFHYRLVLAEIGSPLTTFSSTRLLVSVIHQALIAHKEAYEKANILHRDISANNILIYEDKALLIDWDLSKNENDRVQAREAERTGTWQFTAARLLSSRNVGRHTRTDDIESFVYVLTWIAFKYARHDMSPPLLTGFLRNVFDYAIAGEDGGPDNGGQKARYLKEPDELYQANFKSKNLVNLLIEITEIVSTRYRVPPSVERPGMTRWSDEEQDSEAIYERQMAAAYEKRVKIIYARKMDALLSSDWIIETFNLALSRNDWLQYDSAQEHEIIPDLEPRMVTRSSQQPIRSEDDEEADGEQGDEDDGKSESEEPPVKRPRLNEGAVDRSKKQSE